MIAQKRDPVTEIVPLNVKRARQLMVRDLVVRVKAAQAAKPNKSDFLEFFSVSDIPSFKKISQPYIHTGRLR